MLNVQELIYDPDFAQPDGIKVVRRKSFVENHRTNFTQEELTVAGILTIANSTSIEILHEYDKSSESINLFTDQVLMTTGRQEESVDGYLSDIVLWEGKQYRVIECKNNGQYGYFASVAVKLEQGVI